MQAWLIEVELEIIGRFLVAGSSPGAPGVDTPVSITPSRHLLLPFSAVKGKLREALAESPKGRDWCTEWLGPRETSPSQIERGRLRFTDFVGQTQLADPIPIETRVAINSRRASAQKGMLHAYESPLESGRTDTLKGRIRFVAENEDAAKDVRRHIVAGLRLVTQFGSNRTVGFGRLKAVRSQLHRHSPTATKGVVGTRMLLTLTPTTPFCVSCHRVSENVFESDDRLSGSVIKGAIASMLRELCGLRGGGPATPEELMKGSASKEQWITLAGALDQICITTAFPVPLDKPVLPTVPPLSLVKSDNLVERQGLSLRDVASSSGASLLNGSAPEFAVDWKNASDVKEYFGIVHPQRELRVRTAISTEHRRAADNDLFAYEMVRPDGFRWVCHVDFSGVAGDQLEKVRQAFEQLVQNGIWGIGKTKCNANVLMSEDGSLQPRQELRSSFVAIGNRWIVTLQSDALLHEPSAAHFGELSENHDRLKALKDAYHAYWASVSDAGFELQHYFARQKLAGGEYLGRRFRRSGRPYRPYVLTCAGSVFVLTAQAPRKACEELIAWSRTGLPVPEFVGSNPSFTECPYRPQEGWGQVVVNIPIHQILEPGDKEMTPCYV